MRSESGGRDLCKWAARDQLLQLQRDYGVNMEAGYPITTAIMNYLFWIYGFMDMVLQREKSSIIGGAFFVCKWYANDMQMICKWGGGADQHLIGVVVTWQPHQIFDNSRKSWWIKMESIKESLKISRIPKDPFKIDQLPKNHEQSRKFPKNIEWSQKILVNN